MVALGMTNPTPYLTALANGKWVYCDFADREARTAEGFCQFCGSTSHEEVISWTP